MSKTGQLQVLHDLRREFNYRFDKLEAEILKPSEVVNEDSIVMLI